MYQTFDKKDLYPSIEEKAANLLYLVTINHSFVDGNKRIAAFLFLFFLEKTIYFLKKMEKKESQTMHF
ncbi:MAG: Fic family protein [Bacteroidota bacterium]